MTDSDEDNDSNEDDSLNDRLARGESVVVGNAIYAICPNCRALVKINKWLFGSLHVCSR